MTPFILIWSPHGDEELPWTTLIIRLYWPTQDPDIKDTHWLPTTIKDDTWVHVSSVITIHPNDGSNRLEKYTVSLLVGSVKDTKIQFLDWTSQHLNVHVQYFDMNTFWSLVFAFTRLSFSTGCQFSTDAQSNVLLHFIQASKKIMLQRLELANASLPVQQKRDDFGFSTVFHPSVQTSQYSPGPRSCVLFCNSYFKTW